MKIKIFFTTSFLILILNKLIECDNSYESFDLNQEIRSPKLQLGEISKLKNLEQEFIKKVNQTTQCHLDRVAKLEKRKFRFTAGVIVNDGTRFIVFNCSRPSYLDLSKNLIPIKDTEINQNQEGNTSRVNGKKVVCDLPTNIWKEVDTTRRLVSFNPAKKQFGYVFDEDDLKLVLRLDMYKLDEEQSSMIDNQSLIVSILKTFHHPRYFY